MPLNRLKRTAVSAQQDSKVQLCLTISLPHCSEWAFPSSREFRKMLDLTMKTTWQTTRLTKPMLWRSAIRIVTTTSPLNSSCHRIVLPISLHARNRGLEINRRVIVLRQMWKLTSWWVHRVLIAGPLKTHVEPKSLVVDPSIKTIWLLTYPRVRLLEDTAEILNNK